MKKQNMIRWIAGAALGIACVGFGIHAYYRYEEREAAVQEMEARGQQENKDAEDQKKYFWYKAAKAELDELGVESCLCKTDIADRAQVQALAD